MRHTLALVVLFGLTACSSNATPSVLQPKQQATGVSSSSSSISQMPKIALGWNLEVALSMLPRTDAEWKQRLSPEQYEVLRNQGTERPFTSELLNEHRPGTFITADCGEPVFRSEQKYDSGTGWPSFFAPIASGALVIKEDRSFGSVRTEVLSKCGGHLGHVFTDGPEPTGLRYCMNGIALRFIPD